MSLQNSYTEWQTLLWRQSRTRCIQPLYSWIYNKPLSMAWEYGMMVSMLKTLLTPQLFLLIKSFLSNGQFSVVADGDKSSTRTISTGVPKGNVLVPTLYSLYTSDMPDSRCWTEVEDENVLIATYADDTAFCADRVTPPLGVATLLHTHPADPS